MTIVFAGGGTGGHLYPAIAIANEIKSRMPDADITFVGTKGKIESRIVPSLGFPLKEIWISGFQRRLSLGTILFPLKVLVSLTQSILLIRKKAPDAVVGTGGYVCGPVVAAAQILRRRTLIQEQNSYPGATTRLLAPRADQVHVTFERSRRFLKRQDNVYVSGNPVRGVIGSVLREDASHFFNLDSSKRTVLIFGGSSGASSINTAAKGLVKTLVEQSVQVIWQTGDKDFASLAALMKTQMRGLCLYSYISEMEYAYAASDLVICRAGATSLAEIARVGIASVLVPYPFAAADHQTENAKAMAEAGASVIIADSQLTSSLIETVQGLISDLPTLNRMAQSAKRLGKPEAARTIADAVIRLAHKT